MTTISDADLATLQTKFDALEACNVASNEATQARIVAGTAADAADATYHQAQLDEATADAAEAAAMLDVRTFVDGLFDLTPPVDPNVPPVDPNVPPVTPNVPPGTTIEISPVISVTSATADKTAFYTVPAGPSLKLTKCQLEVQEAFTGAPSAAVGISSSNANSSTPGDLMGGPSGDSAATLVTGIVGTAGPKLEQTILNPGDKLMWNVIAPGFTKGRGILHLTAVTVATTPAPATTAARRR